MSEVGIKRRARQPQKATQPSRQYQGKPNGFDCFGSRHPIEDVTEDVFAKIIQQHRDGTSVEQLSKDWNLSKACIGRLLEHDSNERG